MRVYGIFIDNVLVVHYELLMYKLILFQLRHYFSNKQVLTRLNQDEWVCHAGRGFQGTADNSTCILREEELEKEAERDG